MLEQAIDLLLPLDLRKLLPLHVLAQLVEIFDPLRGQRFHFAAERTLGEKQIEERVGDERSERVLTELAAGERHGGAPGRGGEG